ncbi:MAG: adhesin transport system membrane fusion protein [Planctomycetota bacterium]|jgi:adhesin transport system membrane fusion protein
MATAQDTEVHYPAVELESLQLAGKRRVTRSFGRIMLLVLVLAPIVLALAPWQQNLAGEGRVIEYNPINRPMPLQARTSGIVLKWHVREGQKVHAGDPIVDLADNDPDILLRLREELEATERKQQAASRKEAQFTLQIASAEQARRAAMQGADDEIAAAVQDVTVAEQAATVAKEKLKLAKIALKMWEGLVKDQIGAGYDLEKVRQEHNVAVADVTAKKAYIDAAKAKLRAKRSAALHVSSSEDVKIQGARAKRDAATGDIATAEGSIPILKRNLARQEQQQLTAPMDGFVQNLTASGQGGVYVKQGQTLAVLVPASSQIAVELYIDGNDITFIEVGRHVRLQFEGWPAVQWVGWPSAAVGTFGGKVAFIDRSDEGTGKFRIMVLPDERPFAKPEGVVVDWLRSILTFQKPTPDDNPHAWPGDEYLRQGVRAKGWVVLDRVSLGYEIWRQLNGFPPTIERGEKAKKPEQGK